MAAAAASTYKDRQFLAVIGDEDSVTGLLLAGIGRNFLVVDAKTENSEIERAFKSFTEERKDIAVVLINQHVSPTPHLLPQPNSWDTDPCLQIAERIRHSVDTFTDPFPPSSKYPAKITPTTPRKIAC
ncbi:hypothetical protein N7509_002055 [Penicillium cosmopolitanum]|uniref:V-type proton ATPase subunit F n=1 Tax=Penicillium cosmopolitanum TaxID=1131564 RepID=A0A9W9W8B4_9EURO|nr:uncharacterized protein N7509_002055 [Penicillium cosmopolitanum]KAJ5408172.1 hypothetical protein N7509_002055 [Penicillium cosmopolitanum]